MRCPPDGVYLPMGAVGRASHSWWAMIILICVDMTIFGSFLFAHLHVSMASDVCPPAGAALPAAPWPWAVSALLLAGSALVAYARRRLDAARGQRLVRGLVILGMLCMAGSLAAMLAGHRLAGLDPTAQAWSATVSALLFYQAFHAVVLLLMGGYVCVRSWSGKLRPAARATLDNTALLWHCVTVQGLVATGLVHLLPLWL